MSELITVGISDVKITQNPGALVTYALGSCIGICLYDAALKIGGLAHIMLPCRPENNAGDQINRYADSCLPVMVGDMEAMGCLRARMQAKIAGGAKMFEVADDSAFGSIGARNIAAVKKTLADLGIRIQAEDTGLNYGRTVYFYTDTGMVVVKSFAKGEKRL
ncbi:chemotaxis protein CheD [Caproiciproducens sp. NJN-50]|uniref:chemotaxis protein CheD n=1 Tax=Acutalibacteraceae TaxID=3082771 RepID=UPI000FFE1ED3|nr:MULTISPECIES: chemotaxis protein CheD [Acutalibacteraceae]QAT50670.1 chemotaxis protein CheD [Caproiciproducens sp. NJN-50]